MSMREVRIYDRDFPKFEEMLVGVRPEESPKEVWLQQVVPGEVAVRYKDFKTGLARNPSGEHVQSSEICRIFSSVEEAITDSKTVVKQHWTVRCFIYDHAGVLVHAVSNNRKVGEFAVAAYAGMLLWLATFALIGLSLVWLLFRTSRWQVPSGVVARMHPLALRWLGWTAYAAIGLMLGIALWVLRISFSAKKRVNRLQKNLDSLITSEEKKRFEELSILHGSKDPVERERLLKLVREYQGKITEAMKK